VISSTVGSSPDSPRCTSSTDSPTACPLMNDQSLSAGLVVQGESAGQHIDNIWERMSVPRQRGMRCDGQFDRCELRLSRGIVCVRFAIPGLCSLQQDFAVTARYVLRAALGKYGRQESAPAMMAQLIPPIRYLEIMSIFSIVVRAFCCCLATSISQSLLDEIQDRFFSCRNKRNGASFCIFSTSNEERRIHRWKNESLDLPGLRCQ
jgi:uncharacterized membrane protein (GlpM family)